MSSRARAAALLPFWAIAGSAALASTLAFTAVLGGRAGCLDRGSSNVISVGGIAGFGLAVTALLLVAAVPRYRTAAAGGAAVASLALSVYSVVTFLAQDGALCGP
jgi:hypothetical protein